MHLLSFYLCFYFMYSFIWSGPTTINLSIKNKRWWCLLGLCITNIKQITNINNYLQRRNIRKSKKIRNRLEMLSKFDPMNKYLMNNSWHKMNIDKICICLIILCKFFLAAFNKIYSEIKRVWNNRMFTDVTGTKLLMTYQYSRTKM